MTTTIVSLQQHPKDLDCRCYEKQSVETQTMTTITIVFLQQHPKNLVCRCSEKKKRVPAEQEVVYLFRVLLDGNEKFIWLQAAAELGRLTERAVMCHVPFDNVIK